MKYAVHLAILTPQTTHFSFTEILCSFDQILLDIIRFEKVNSH